MTFCVSPNVYNRNHSEPEGCSDIHLCRRLEETLRIWRIFTLLGRPPAVAGGINGSRIVHSASERSLAEGFIGQFLLPFRLFFFIYLSC